MSDDLTYLDRAALVARVYKAETELTEARAALARVGALRSASERLAGVRFLGEPFPAAVTLADLDAALEGGEAWEVWRDILAGGDDRG